MTKPRHLRLASENPSSPRISALRAFDPCIEICSSHTKSEGLLNYEPHAMLRACSHRSPVGVWAIRDNEG
jgi:hypothetical protein